MFLSGGVLLKAILLVAGIAWCVVIIRRFPTDVSELCGLYRKYRNCNDPDVLGTMRTEERKKHYQEDCVSQFWTALAIQLLFFWPVTAIVSVLVLPQ